MTDHTSVCRSFWWLALVPTLLLGADVVFEATADATADSAAPQTALEVVVTGNLPQPLHEVRDVLLDLAEFGSWFPALGEWRVLSRDLNSALVYGKQNLPWPVRDRDYVVLYRWWMQDDDSFFLEAIAQRDAAPAAPAGVVRLERMRTLWRLRPVGRSTEARYTYSGEAGGLLPDWVARIGWESRTGVVLQALVDEVARRTAR